MAGCYNLADLCRPPAAQRIVNIPFSGASPAFMTKQSKPKYRRILLKLSGEALGGESGVGICPEAIHDMACQIGEVRQLDRKSTRLNSSHRCISYAVFCLKKKK